MWSVGILTYEMLKQKWPPFVAMNWEGDKNREKLKNLKDLIEDSEEIEEFEFNHKRLLNHVVHLENVQTTKLTPQTDPHDTKSFGG